MSATGYSAQLDRKRATMARRLSHAGELCAIYRPSKTLSASGRPVDSETLVTSDVPCLLVRSTESLATREQMTAGEVVAITAYTLFVPWDTDVRASDQVEIDGRRLEVISGTEEVTTQFVRELGVVEINPNEGA